MSSVYIKRDLYKYNLGAELRPICDFLQICRPMLFSSVHRWRLCTRYCAVEI